MNPWLSITLENKPTAHSGYSNGSLAHSKPIPPKHAPWLYRKQVYAQNITHHGVPFASINTESCSPSDKTQSIRKGARI